jgi:transcriptional regulator with XRE-family HTH domain
LAIMSDKQSASSPVTLGQFIRRARGGRSQAEFAALAGVSVSYVSGIESGDRVGSVRTLNAIARAIGVSPDDLANLADAARAARLRNKADLLERAS